MGLCGDGWRDAVRKLEVVGGQTVQIVIAWFGGHFGGVEVVESGDES